MIKYNSDRQILSPGVERRLDALGRERDLAEPRAGGVEHCIPDGGADHRDSGFYRAGGTLVGPIDQHGFDLRDLEARSQAAIVAPINRSDLLIVPSDMRGGLYERG